MRLGKWIFIVLAFFAATCMIGIGIAVGERSILGILLAIIGLNAVMATGFIMKKKLREKGILE
ncbi:YlaF family protein [Metabacillus litoralis]|jgi:4-hydroxybenzoate polyprenyltransferase|uniref:YlaF family protein n=1 Tax=Metabacillus litoralis TaxID=152268 RepID=UPI002041FDC3|nr:YlaF family protein [Metabacillus litoralis]MCM3652794.1 YlaF family protein [Metabacillus litoralis]